MAIAQRSEPLEFMADNEPAMQEAFEAARSGLDSFLAMARARPVGASGFAVKVGIRDRGPTEYFWISDFVEREGTFTGKIDNDPQLVKSVKLGGNYTFSKQQIVDWTYRDEVKHAMVGNFTYCALLTKRALPLAQANQVRHNLQCEAVGLPLAKAIAAQNAFKFGDGAGELLAPKHYRRVEDPDASLVLVSVPEGNVKLYFDLHKLDSVVHFTNPGEARVREQAKNMDKSVKQLADKVVLFDPSPVLGAGSEAVVNLHWQIGFGKTVVVMSACAPQAARTAPDVQRFLGGDLEMIVSTLKRIAN